jgi:hypothetical protein
LGPRFGLNHDEGRGEHFACHTERIHEKESFADFIPQLQMRNIKSFYPLNDPEECRLLGFNAVWLLYEPTFRMNLEPPS